MLSISIPKGTSGVFVWKGKEHVLTTSAKQNLRSLKKLSSNGLKD